jgi:hypothetical protein
LPTIATEIKHWYTALTAYEKRTLQIALALTLVTRLIFVIASLLHHPVAIEVDTYRYLAIANEPGFARWFDLNDPAGYPILLKITGSTLTAYGGILVLQALLSTATIGLLFVAGRSLLTEGWNRKMLWLAALSPLSMFFSSQLMTETSFCFFFVLATVILLKCSGKDKRKLLLFLGGLSLSFATLIRPSSMVTIVFLGPLLLFYVYAKEISLSNALSFIAGSFLLVGFYGLGLKIKYNYFGISVKGPTTLSIYYGIPIMQSAGFSDHDIDSTIAALPVAERYLDQSRPDHIDGETFAHQHNALFLQLLKEHPVDVLKVHFLGMAQMLAWPPAGLFQLSKHFGALPADASLKEMEFQNIFGPLVRLRFGRVYEILHERLGSTPVLILFIWFIATVVWIILLPFALLGLVFLMLDTWKSRLPFQFVLFLAVILSYLFLIPHVAAGARFRMPIEPLLILCGIYALQGLRSRISKSHSPVSSLL